MIKSLFLCVVPLFFLLACSFNGPGFSNNGREEVILERAMYAYENELYGLSVEQWELLIEKHPGSYYLPLAELKLADAYLAGGRSSEALNAYQKFISMYDGHEAAAYARLQIGNTLLSRYRGVHRDQSPVRDAKAEYEQFIRDFPAHELTAQAEDKIYYCSELLSKYEEEVANFYQKRGMKEAEEFRRYRIKQYSPETISK